MSTTPLLIFQLNLAQRLLMNEVDRKLRDSFGVTATQAAALIYLKNNDGCQMNDLSRELHQSKSAITTLVERLGKHGFIDKIASPEDKRVFCLKLTDKGNRTALDSVKSSQFFDDQLKELLSIKEQEVVSTFLHTLIAKYGHGDESFFMKNSESKD